MRRISHELFLETRRLKLYKLNNETETLSDIVNNILKRPEFEEKFKLDQATKPHIDRLTVAVNQGVKQKYESLKKFQQINTFLLENGDLKIRYPNILTDIEFVRKQIKMKKLIDYLPEWDQRATTRNGKHVLTIEQDVETFEASPEAYMKDYKGLMRYIERKYDDEETFLNILDKSFRHENFLRWNDSKNIKADVEWIKKHALTAKKSSRKVCASKPPHDFFALLPKKTNFTRRI